MNLGIDISQIVYEGTGVARFVNGLVNSIVTYDKTNLWTFFFSSFRQELSPDIRNSIKNHGHRIVEVRLPPTALSFLWNSLHRMNVEKFTGKLDCFITSDWTEPPSRLKKATVIHDLAFMKYPETVHPAIRKTQKQRLRWVAKESSIIFADSHSTKQDIEHELLIDPSHIFVNYPGVEVIKPSVAQIEKTLRKFHLHPQRYILTVGKIEPRKNIRRLIAAYEKINTPDYDLVIVGHQGWDEETKKIKEQRHPHIRFLNYITDQELQSLYSSCLCFAYPSLYEGFGYPVVEAMLNNAPVITSSSSSLQEIGKGAALLFDPTSVDDIANALARTLQNPTLRMKLKHDGAHKAALFSWSAYYKRMVDIISTCYNSHI